MQFIRLMLVFLMILIGNPAFATTPHWIIKHTKGRVSQDLAVKISRNIYLYALSRDLDPSTIFQIISVESGYRQKVVSSKNARGLMQIMKRWHPEKVKKRNLFVIETNIEIGAWVLDEYIQKYGSEREALRAYYGSKDYRYVDKVYSVDLSDPDYLLVPDEQFSELKVQKN